MPNTPVLEVKHLRLIVTNCVYVSNHIKFKTGGLQLYWRHSHCVMFIAYTIVMRVSVYYVSHVDQNIWTENRITTTILLIHSFQLLQFSQSPGCKFHSDLQAGLCLLHFLLSFGIPFRICLEIMFLSILFNVAIEY